MADSNPNISIPRNQWVNLYIESGIPVGTAISVDNVGDPDVWLTVQLDQPEPDHDAYVVVKRDGPPYRNSQGDSGAWAFCQGNDAKVNVRELT